VSAAPTILELAGSASVSANSPTIATVLAFIVHSFGSSRCTVVYTSTMYADNERSGESSIWTTGYLEPVDVVGRRHVPLVSTLDAQLDGLVLH
jgi:hypothetical protein